MLAPLLFNIFFVAVINVAYTRFKADKDIIDALVHQRNRKGAGGAGGSNYRRASLSDAALGHAYADDGRVVSQSPEKLRKVMGVIVVLCAAFGLPVSETRTEMILCLRTKRLPESTAIFSIEVAGKMYNQTNEFVHLGGGTSTTMPTCPSRSTGAYATHGAAFGSIHSNCTTDRALPSSSKSGC